MNQASFGSFPVPRARYEARSNAPSGATRKPLPQRQQPLWYLPPFRGTMGDAESSKQRGSMGAGGLWMWGDGMD